MTALFTIRNLVQCYGARTVLHIPELVLEQGVIYALLGPNGSGKSTLLKRLAFLETPTQGVIECMGQTATPENTPALRAKVVWVPQWPVMFTGTLRYNVEYPMRLKKIAPAVRHERAEHLMQAVGIHHLANSPARHLSGGEAQRASIARAMATGAEIILFDEPTANVDYHARGELITLMQGLHTIHGLHLIVTTHDPGLAKTLCHKTITLGTAPAPPGQCAL